MKFVLDLIDKTIDFGMPSYPIKAVTEQYPETVHLRAMEELAELSQAISKLIRNGGKKHIDNFVEEATDTIIHLQYLLSMYDIDPDHMREIVNAKLKRETERIHDGCAIFRTDSAKKKHAKRCADYVNQFKVTPADEKATLGAESVQPPIKREITPDDIRDYAAEHDCLFISIDPDDPGMYTVDGDISRLPMYAHSLLTGVAQDDPELAAILAKDFVAKKFMTNVPKKKDKKADIRQLIRVRHRESLTKEKTRDRVQEHILTR